MLVSIAIPILNGILLNFFNSILLSRDYLSVIVIFDGETDYLATGIISSHKELFHNWYAINLDINPERDFNQFQKLNYTNLMVISVFRSQNLLKKIRKSIVILYGKFREYTSHLICTTGKLLEYERTLIAELDFNSVLVMFTNATTINTIEVLTIDARYNNLFINSNDELNNENDEHLYKRLFYDKSLNMFGRRLNINAGLQYPPRLINIIKQCKHKKNPKSVCFQRAIGGYDGFIATTLNKYFNATIVAFALQLSVSTPASVSGPFLNFYRSLDKTYVVEDVDSIIVING